MRIDDCMRETDKAKKARDKAHAQWVDAGTHEEFLSTFQAYKEAHAVYNLALDAEDKCARDMCEL